MPVARSSQAPVPSLLEEAEVRRQRAKLVGWLLLGLIVMFTLCWVLSWTIWELVGMFASVPWTRAVKENPEPERVLPTIASEKLVSMAGDVTKGLELWTSAARNGASEDIVEAAARLSTQVTGIQDEVRALQENLAKSLSVGSVVGLVTRDNDQAQVLLKEEQAVVVEQSGKVHTLAGRIIREHEEHQRSSELDSADGGAGGGGDEDGARAERRRVGREQDLMNKLDYGLGEASPERMWALLQEAEANINAGVLLEDAEEMVGRYSASAAERARELGQQQSERASDQDITHIVEDVVRFVDLPSPPQECVSVEHAQSLARTELERYGADRTGIPDYAMELTGARVIDDLTSDTYEAPMGILDKMINSRRKATLKAVSQPPVAINPDSRLGMCWPMKGYEGKLTVKLSQAINVESISIEHGARELLLNNGISALKDFTVIGYPTNMRVGDVHGHVLVSGGEYHLEGDVIQFFEVAEEYRRVEYGAVALEVDSNHGEDAYTCIYRFRVHGTPTA